MGSVTETMGTLTLTSSSTLNLSGSIFTFADSSGADATWSSGSLLGITGWNGNTGGGGADQVNFGASGLSATQLSQIRFYNPGGGLAPGVYFGSLTAGGELVPGTLVPVPEPSTLPGGMFIIGCIAVDNHR